MPINKPKKPTAIDLAKISEGPIPCEICGILTPTVSTHSVIIVYAMPGQDEADLPFVRSLPPYQCDSEQHFGCTFEHAALAAVTCMMHHMNDSRHQGDATIKDVTLSMIATAVEKHS